jgi:Trypsin-like peptidase domain
MTSSTAVLRVGDGRGFVVGRLNHLGSVERVVITAAHCVMHRKRLDGIKGLPPPHPARGLEEDTYPKLLGPLNGKQTVWATCMFIDPIADIAVFGPPDNQELYKEADAYEALMKKMGWEALPVADAPAQGTERIYIGKDKFERAGVGEAPAQVLSLKRGWLKGRVQRRTAWLSFEPRELFECGMSGSPILDEQGAAIGVVSVDHFSPVIVDNLSVHMLRSIEAAANTPKRAAIVRPRPKGLLTVKREPLPTIVYTTRPE